MLKQREEIIIKSINGKRKINEKKQILAMHYWKKTKLSSTCMIERLCRTGMLQVAYNILYLPSFFTENMGEVFSTRLIIAP